MVFKQHPYNANPGTRPATPAIIMLWVTLTAAVCFSSTVVWAQTFGEFSNQSNSTNPLAGINVGEFATPFVVDLDVDGDLDILVGYDSDPGVGVTGLIRYYKNDDGTMHEQTGSANPFATIVLDGEPKLAAADFNNDTLPEVIIGEDGSSTLHYYLNTGSQGSPAFLEQLGGNNPFNGLAVDTSVPNPSVVDMDDDGDIDVFVGQDQNGPEIIFIENTGNATDPSFALVTGAGDPFNGLPLHGEVGLAWGDLDLDGDIDAILGGQTISFEGTIHYFENTQNATEMVLEEQTVEDPFTGFIGNGAAKPTVGDFDGDTDIDVLVGYINGEVLYFQNEFFPADGITLSATVLPENKPKNTVVGTLGHTNATYTEFSLVNNSCGEDNFKFSISASDELLTKRMFSYEQHSLFHIEVQARDSGLLYDPDNRCFVIRVTDERELFPSTLIPLGIP